jgi:hypothetical protein
MPSNSLKNLEDKYFLKDEEVKKAEHKFLNNEYSCVAE